eukprot:gene4379-2300_t
MRKSVVSSGTTMSEIRTCVQKGVFAALREVYPPLFNNQPDTSSPFPAAIRNQFDQSQKEQFNSRPSFVLTSEPGKITDRPFPAAHPTSSWWIDVALQEDDKKIGTVPINTFPYLVQQDGCYVWVGKQFVNE